MESTIRLDESFHEAFINALTKNYRRETTCDLLTQGHQELDIEDTYNLVSMGLIMTNYKVKITVYLR